MNENVRPGWLKDAVFYEIYPQSFCDSNADGIGDIRGIISKLDYITGLGCNAIWINPCFKSPFSDAGYDVEDYYTVAERYGTNEDLKELFSKAHERGMHVLLDLVPGHTSTECRWFRESMKAEKNEFTDRYIWTDSIWESPEGLACIRGISERDGSCVTNFFSCQPALNYGFYDPDPAKPWQQPTSAPGPQSTISAMKDVMSFWLSLGCDGFRVDMAGSLVKNDHESRGTIALWQGIRAFLDESFPEAALISEWGEPDKSLEAGFHMDFLLHFGPSHYNDLFRCSAPYFSRNGAGSFSEFAAVYMENLKKTSGRGLICIPSGNHDMERLSLYLDESQRRLAFTFILTMPGVPFIYYGDETGMRYLEGLTSKEGGYGRTGSRTPMQWDDTANAGFSAAAPGSLYLPIDPFPGRPTAKKAVSDSGSVYHLISELIALRRSMDCLSPGADIRFISDGYPLIYERTAAGDRCLVVINPTGSEIKTDLQFSEILFAVGEAPRREYGETFISPVSAAVIR